MTREQIGDTLALVNAILNASSAVLIVMGRIAIAKKVVKVHRAAMIGAFLTSALFLCSYLTRVAMTGTHADPHSGPLHVFYIGMLISHMILAVAVVPLVLRTLWLARGRRFPEHRAIARITFPIWLYVSVTGVLVYVILYRVPA